MDQWRLVADSSCDLVPDTLSDDQVKFASVPLTIIVGNAQYVDIPATDTRRMMVHMKEFKGASSSSCPSPDDFAREFVKAANTIAVTITSGLSGTYNSALQGVRLALEQNPDSNIHVVDSHATSGSMILILRRLRELIAQDLSFEDIVEQIERYRDTMRIIFSLASFDNLVKTGRMSKTSGVLASALNIRAVAINTAQGVIQVLEKPRGQKKAIERMVALMETVKDMAGVPVVISHCNNPEGARQLCDAVRAAYAVNDITICETHCLTSFYSGDQGLLLSF